MLFIKFNSENEHGRGKERKAERKIETNRKKIKKKEITIEGQED